MNKHWAQLIIGAWIMISPWLLGFSSITIMKWSDLMCGLAIVLINVWTIFGGAQSEISSGKEGTKVGSK